MIKRKHIFYLFIITIIIIFSFINYISITKASLDDDSDLVLHLSMNSIYEDYFYNHFVLDSTPYENIGLLSDEYYLVSGKFNNCINFIGGNGGKATLPDVEEFKPISNFSIALWINLTDTDGAIPQLFSHYKSIGGIEYGYRLILYPIGHPRLEIYGLTGYNQAIYDLDVRDGNWHFIVGTYNGQSIKLYVDNNAPAISSFNQNVNYYFDSAPTISGNWFKGDIDEVRFYNRTLSDSEITQLFNWNEYIPPSDIEKLQNDVMQLTNNQDLLFVLGITVLMCCLTVFIVFTKTKKRK